jgi:hypothetical protein
MAFDPQSIAIAFAEKAKNQRECRNLYVLILLPFVIVTNKSITLLQPKRHGSARDGAHSPASAALNSRSQEPESLLHTAVIAMMPVTGGNLASAGIIDWRI